MWVSGERVFQEKKKNHKDAEKTACFDLCPLYLMLRERETRSARIPFPGLTACKAKVYYVFLHFLMPNLRDRSAVDFHRELMESLDLVSF